MKHESGTGPYSLSAAILAIAIAGSDLRAQKVTAMAVDSPRSTPRSSPRPSPSTAALDAATRKFSKLTDRKQEAALEVVRAAVRRIEDPYLRSLLPFADAGRKSDKPRHKPLRVGKRRGNSETAVSTAQTVVEQLPFRARCEFRFAYGDIAAREPVVSKRRTSKRKKQRAARVAELEDLLKGHTVDGDYALAAILRELDTDRSADACAVFLDSWRNGAETFYQALQRTAGTGKGVFCYDAMLSDWVRRCVPKKHADRKRMIRSMDDTQKAFYQSAATYRAYRSVRELVALTLVLPPDAKLPKELAKRYDKTTTGYSTRDVVTLILAAHGGDVGATVRTIVKNLEHMPKTLWQPGFNSVQALYHTQDTLMPKITAGGKHSDQTLAEQKAKRSAVQDRVAQTARTALLGALGL